MGYCIGFFTLFSVTCGNVLTGEPVLEDMNSQHCASFSYPQRTILDLDSYAKGYQIPRNYGIPVTKEEKQDLKYIVTTLGNSSLVKIMSSRSSIKKAGERIDHLHPLRFLACIFTDEEMKVAMQNMMGRSFVWKQFLNGLAVSFSEEKQLNNISKIDILDCASVLNVDFEVLYIPIQKERWSDLVKTLIALIPRQGDIDRYDM